MRRPLSASRRIVAGAGAAAMLLGAGPAAAFDGAPAPSHSPGVADGAFDAVVLRPLGLVASVAGAAFFAAAAAPVALYDVASGVDEFRELPDTWDLFLVRPYHYTFTRPLGDF